jgi:HlyD family secretion protein
MTATVKIITAERKDVLRVPDQALRYTPGGVAHGRGGAAGTAGRGGQEAVGTAGAGSDSRSERTAVWVLRNGQPVRVPVRVGLDDNVNAEIVKGNLQPGDRVIVSEEAAGEPSGRGRSAPRLRF